MSSALQFKPEEFRILDSRLTNLHEISAAVPRDGRGRVGAVLTFDSKGQKATLLGFAPLVEYLADTLPKGAPVDVTGALAYLANGWPENWLDEDGWALVPAGRRLRPRPQKVASEVSEAMEPWVEELLRDMDKLIESS